MQGLQLIFIHLPTQKKTCFAHMHIVYRFLGRILTFIIVFSANESARMNTLDNKDVQDYLSDTTAGKGEL